MPLAADRLLFPPGWRVTRMALKWSGVSTTLGSLVTATIVRVIAGAVGVVWADADSARAITVNSAVPNVIIRTVTSLVRGRGQCPLLPRKRTFAYAISTSALGHVWTAPAVQEESDVLRSVRVQPCIRPVFEWRSDLHCDAAAVAAGPDVIR